MPILCHWCLSHGMCDETHTAAPFITEAVAVLALLINSQCDATLLGAVKSDAGCFRGAGSEVNCPVCGPFSHVNGRRK